MNFLLEPNIQFILVGSISIAIATSITGVFSVLQSKALLADVIGHSALPGVSFSFIIAHELSLPLVVIFSFISGLLSSITLQYLERHPKISTEAAMGISLLGFFSLGLMLVSFIQQSQSSGQSGIQSFLFGNAASISRSDSLIYLLISLTILLTVLVFKKAFTTLSFQYNYVQSFSSARIYQSILNAITVVSIAISLQAMGVVLVSALLIIPAVTSQNIFNRINPIMSLSIFVSIVAVFSGTIISYHFNNMPTGPWIVVTLFVTFLISGIYRKLHGRK